MTYSLFVLSDIAYPIVVVLDEKSGLAYRTGQNTMQQKENVPVYKSALP